MTYEPLKKNKAELSAEEQCHAEVSAVLKKYNCVLEGYAETRDDYDNDYTIRVREFKPESLDYERRCEAYRVEQAELKKRLDAQTLRDAYDELIRTYPEFKDLEVYKVGKTEVSSFWFKGLKVREERVNESLFRWNGNGYWQYSVYGASRDGVHLSVGNTCDFFGYDGTPHITTFGWKVDKEGHEHNQHVKWFAFDEKVTIRAYHDMMGVCRILSDLIKVGILSLVP